MINKEKNIKLSIIVSVYNVKEYLEDCLRSLSEQNIQNVEFIIVDDGSTDGSSEICDHWGLCDKRFTIIHQENKGLFLARETGILKSRGNRIIFVDGDDKLEENALCDIIKLIEQCNADIIQFSSKPFNCINKKQFLDINNYLSSHNKTINSNIDIAKSFFIDKSINWNLWNKIFNSDLLKKSCREICDYKCTCAEDVYRMFLISFYANSFQSYNTRPLYLYRVNSGISTKKQNINTFISHIQYVKIISNIDLFLQQEHASQYWYKCLDSVKNHLYSSLIYIMANLPKKDFIEAFNIFYREYNIIDCLPWLEQNFIGRQNDLASAYINSLYNKNNKITENCNNAEKTMGIFYHRFYNGGVERVISLQIPIFIKLGYKIIFFTEEINEELEYSLPHSVIRIQLPVSYTQERAEVFLSAIKKYNVSIVCHHATSSLRLLFDLIFLREARVHTIITAHETTAFSIARRARYSFDRVVVYRLADILLTLSSTEEYFYRQCGVNSLYMPNPVVDIDTSDSISVSQRKPTVLWLGRLEEKQKNYKEALKILRIIVNQNNNITCYFIGSGDIKDNIYVKLFIKCNRLGKKIIYIPYTKNVDIYYKKASVQLVTSSFEAFPMVIVEGKLYGLPLVTYDLPIVELLKDGKGYICVERHNIQEAAHAVLKILEDREFAERLSNEARDSIESFLHFDLAKAWSKILNEPYQQYFNATEKDVNNMCLFWMDLFSMYHEGLPFRISVKQKLKNKLIQIKFLIKTILTPLLPIGSRRRVIVIKVYHSIKKNIKIKLSNLGNFILNNK